MNLIRFIFAILIITGVYTPADAQSEMYYNFNAVVSSDDGPLAECNLIIYTGNYPTGNAKTDLNGYVKVLLPYNQKYRIVVNKENYAPKELYISTLVEKLPSGKIMSEAHAIIMKKSESKAEYLQVNEKGLLSETEAFSPQMVSLPARTDYSAEGQKIIKKAQEFADSLVEDAYGKAEEIGEKALKDAAKIFGTDLSDTDSDIKLANNILNEEEKKEFNKLNSKHEETTNLETESDSLNLINKIIERKELLLKAAEEKLKYAKEAKDTAQIKELQKVIKRLKPEVNTFKTERDRLQALVDSQKTKLTAQKRKIFLFAVTGAILILFILVILWFWRQKRKQAKKLAVQNTLLEKQKSEIKQQAEMLLEANAKISQSNTELQKKNQQIEKQNEQINSSINYASTIQSAVLPADSVLQKHFNYFIIYMPKDLVSGDFYWFSDMDDIPLPEGVKEMKMISVADCTGHGVPGAFMSMISTQLLNQIVNEEHTSDPAQVLTKLDGYINKALRQDQTENRDGIDLGILFVKYLNNGKTELIYSGAKRVAYHFSKKQNKILRINANRRAIGGSSKARTKTIPFENETIEVEPNDIVYLSSDGLADQNNARRKKLGTKTVKKILLQNAEKSLDSQKQELIKVLEEHKKGTEQRDDISFMGIKF